MPRGSIIFAGRRKSPQPVKYSVIVPVFNRPDEVSELLESLARQQVTDAQLEVLIVEDGSTTPCKEVVKPYERQLDVHYYMKPNSGPGQSRNYGVQRSTGDYVLILDSDVVVPDGWLEAIDNELKTDPCDAFGGPDTAHESFTDVQKAISYAMTSFFTTGGIRGGRGRKLDKFYPRSFNMGVKREVYQQLGGFSNMRFGEDIDFSYRLVENGCSTRLFPSAWVWHKRRTDFDKFYRQVFNSGIARINLEKRHPGTLKLVHLLPAAFTVGVTLLILLAVVLRLIVMNPDSSIPSWAWVVPLLPFVLYMLLLFLHSTLTPRSTVVGFLSMKAAFIQLFGYGLGFLSAWWKRCVLGHGEFAAYEKTFYD